VLDRRDAALAPLTTLRLGGPARRLVTVYDEASLLQVLADGPALVLGGGSNVVLPDAGIDGTVVRLALHGTSARPCGEHVLVTVAAGEDWDVLVAHTVAEGLAGLEALSGIPGSVGASPVQNIGAYGQEVADTVTSVRAYDRLAGQVVERPAAACGFAYRTSVFKAEPDRWVVLSVDFALAPGALSAPVAYAELARVLGVAVGARAPLEEVREAVLRLRKGKGMVVDPTDPDSRSVGSFFTNPRLTAKQFADLKARVPGVPSWAEADGRTKVPAAWLVEHAGFAKGAFPGPVGISSKHTLALVHRGGGTTAELLAVARAVRDGVRDATGVELVNEPVLVGEVL